MMAEGFVCVWPFQCAKFFNLKGHRMLNSLYKLFEQMCVVSVCTHPSYNDKNPPSVFLKIPILKSPFSNQAVLYRPLPRELIDRTVLP